MSQATLPAIALSILVGYFVVESIREGIRGSDMTREEKKTAETALDVVALAPIALRAASAAGLGRVGAKESGAAAGAVGRSESQAVDDLLRQQSSDLAELAVDMGLDTPPVSLEAMETADEHRHPDRRSASACITETRRPHDQKWDQMLLENRCQYRVRLLGIAEAQKYPWINYEDTCDEPECLLLPGATIGIGVRNGMSTIRHYAYVD